MLPEAQGSCDAHANSAGELSSAAVLRERDERLQALKDLVAHLAHDFNNSLVPLIGYITLLNEELDPGVAGYQYLTKLDAAVRKSEKLIELLLEATHPERRFSPKWIDLAALLQRISDAWLAQLPPEPRITLERDLVPTRLSLDEVQWTKLVQHVLKNAQSAMTEPGPIKLSLRPRALSPAESASYGIRSSSVHEFLVEDSGCGMTEEVLKRACDPLFSSEADSTTPGLGLTLVHSVVRLHGGLFSLESVLGTGTKVRIWLPAS